MTDKIESPFVPGARVAIRSSGYGNDGYHEGFVDKVHKPRGRADYGNIVLRGSPQQYSVRCYRGYRDGAGDWHAHSTGGGWHGATVYLWTDKIDQEIVEASKERARRKLQDTLRARFEREVFTWEQLSDVELILKVVEEDKTQSG